MFTLINHFRKILILTGFCFPSSTLAFHSLYIFLLPEKWGQFHIFILLLKFLNDIFLFLHISWTSAMSNVCITKQCAYLYVFQQPFVSMHCDLSIFKSIVLTYI